MVTWPRRQFDIAQLLQLPFHGRLCQGHAKFRIELPRQVDQPPEHNPVDGWHRSTFNDSRKSLALGIIQHGFRPDALP